MSEIIRERRACNYMHIRRHTSVSVRAESVTRVEEIREVSRKNVFPLKSPPHTRRPEETAAEPAQSSSATSTSGDDEGGEVCVGKRTSGHKAEGAIISDLQKMGMAERRRIYARVRRTKGRTRQDATRPSPHRAGKSKHEGQGVGKTERPTPSARVHNARHELNIRYTRSDGG